MNNSLARMIDGMVSTLRQEIIPRIDTEYARGQAFGVVYMLNSIKLRADWSPEFIGGQIEAQQELSAALKPLIRGLGAPDVPDTSAVNVAGQALERVRNDIDGRICALIEWLDDHSAEIDPVRAEAIESQLRQYMNRQLKWELETSAKPMFAEMSSGSE
jgi:hypothetical protein